MQNNNLFPYSSLRRGQKEIMDDLHSMLSCGCSGLLYIPPGVGKTAAVLTSALEYCTNSKKRLFYLAEKGYQHHSAIGMLKEFSKNMPDLRAMDIMISPERCPNFKSTGDMAETCLNDDRLCPNEDSCECFGRFDLNVYRSIKEDMLDFKTAEEICIRSKLCPLEMVMSASIEAQVVVCNYRYIFSSMVQKHLDLPTEAHRDAVLVIDDGHSLPDWLRASLSYRISPALLSGAASEADCLHKKNLKFYLEGMRTVLMDASERMTETELELDRPALIESLEALLKRRTFDRLDMDGLLEGLQILDAEALKSQRSTCASRVLTFLRQWRNPSGPVVGILHPGGALSLKCVDPSVVSQPVFESVHSALLMSSTQIPSEMFIDILGIPKDKVKAKSYGSFGSSRPLNLLCDKQITTQADKRDPEMYTSIATEVLDIASYIPGNIGVFFPSYAILEKTYEELKGRTVPKEIIPEVQDEDRSAKEEKTRRLTDLAATGGGILLAVQGGYFSDSPEFKRNTLHGILVVGVPFSKPDIEQKAMTEFMKSRFGGMKGYYYSQIYPAMTKVLRVLSGGASGDKGVCVLMDQRFKDSKFLKALPPEYHFDIEPDIKSRLGEFFSGPDQHLMLPGDGDKYQH